MRSLATTPAALLALALLLAGPGRCAVAPAAEPPAPLPDSVLASVGGRSVTVGEFLRQWQGLAPGMRPPGPVTAQTKRAFLDELVNKEALTLAAEGAAYALSSEETAQLANLRASLMRQEYYRREVIEAPTAEPDPVAAGRDADPQARVAERERQLIERLVAPLALRFDDGAVALLAGAFGKLPPPREQGPGWMRMQVTTWPPPVLPADTARVLATSTLGPFTIGRFLWFWDRVPAAQRDRPDSAQAIVEWTQSFFAQGRIDAEAERLGFGRLPQVEAQLTARRQILAVERYYRTAVLARVDTSDAVLTTAWRKDPRSYDGPALDRYHGLWYPSRAEAETAVRALARGAAWDSLLATRFAAPDDPQLALLRRREADLFREPQVLGAGTSDSTLRDWFAGARPGRTFGPRERAGQWWVYRYLDHRDGKRATFAEARPYVVQRVLAADGEAQLTAHLEELRRRYGVRVNETALAALAPPADPVRPVLPGSGAPPKE